jgi:pyrroline-5-carboxylate reductase
MLQRAARIGDGWMHAGSDQETLERLIARIGELRREYGRDREPFEIHVISPEGYTIDGVRRLEDLGVTDVIVSLRNPYEPDTQTLEEKSNALRQFADDVITKM